MKAKISSLLIAKNKWRRIASTALAVACFGLCAKMASANPVITNVFPTGTHLFESSGSLSFNAISSVGVSNISVQLTATKLTGGSPFLRTLTTGNGLSVSGAATNESVSASLSSNRFYTAVIQVTDNGGGTSSSTISFDTINPSYTFEAEDYDYSTNGVSGLFIDNPQTNAYAGLAATDGVDFHHDSSGGHAYRPGGLASETAGDVPRAQYIGTGKTDYDIGFNNGGDFANYTHHYPAGVYNVFLRGSDGNGPTADSASMTVSAGSATLAGNGSFIFSVPPAGGWQVYSWVPLKDSSGNLVQLTTDGSAATLHVNIDGGNMNANFYMLVPADTNSSSVADATITNIYPDGSYQFQMTNALTFNINSTLGVNNSDITVQLAATNLSGVGSSHLLSDGNGLSISGASTNKTVSITLSSNLIYTAFIQVIDANGTPASTNVSFDTIVPAYTFESEDFDYGSGQFIPDPQTNAYALQDGTSGVDFVNNNPNTYSYQRIGLSTEGAGDVPRLSHVGFQDYDVGFNNGGNWANYTRQFPAGTYNIYLRAADGNGSSTDSASVSQVTSGFGTSSQTITRLGTFSVQASGGWQKYEWVPLKDVAGNLVQFVGGTTNTLRITTDNGNYNANFVLLMPADVTVKVLPHVDNFIPDGSGLFQYTNALSFIAHSQIGLAAGNVTLNLDGVTVSGLTVSGPATALQVSYPVAPNAYHTAIITVSDANGTVSSTNSFGTFSSTNFTWEAEDYDYGGGLFIPDAQADAYSGQPGVSGVDFLETDPNSNEGFPYRSFPAMPTSSAGDQARDQFTSINGTDYNIGYFGGGSWLNYTRAYPPGTYNVIGRFAEGASATEAILSQVTGGFGTTNQTLKPLGTFYVAPGGWSTWEWASLMDASGRPAKITLTGPTNTLQLGGSPVSGHPEVNVNFLMLVASTPDIVATVSVSGATVTISFPTQSGASYQVQYKNKLSDTTWLPLGSVVAGNSAVQSVNDSVTGSSRFYRVHKQ